MEILMLIFSPIVAMFAGLVGINNALNGAVDKLYEGFDAFLDRIGLEDWLNKKEKNYVGVLTDICNSLAINFTGACQNWFRRYAW